MTTGFDVYTNLLIQFPPRLIRSDEEYWQIQDVIDKLLDIPDLSQEQLDYLSLLGMLIERYDTENDILSNESVSFIMQVKHQPPSILTGSVTMSDDLLEPTMSDTEWDDSLDRTVRQIVGDPEAFH